MNEHKPLYHHVRDVASRAARAAGSIIRSAVGHIHADAIRSKGLHDLVTEIDEKAETIILEIIRSEFPEHRFMAEESFTGDFSDFDRVDALWIIDPIDGTTNFTRGVPPYAVSIAFRHNRELVVGVVYDVAHDELFSAVLGDGLMLNGVRAGVSSTSNLTESLVTTGFPYRAYLHIDPYLAVLKRFMQTTRGVRRPGSASVDLAWVASGRFDVFFETGLMPWDVAAGIVLVREGGGHISDYSGNSDPSFTAQIVASNGIFHDQVLEFLSPLKNVYE